MASLRELVETLRERLRVRRLNRALKRRPDAETGGVTHKLPPEHHNRATGG